MQTTQTKKEKAVHDARLLELTGPGLVIDVVGVDSDAIDKAEAYAAEM